VHLILTLRLARPTPRPQPSPAMTRPCPPRRPAASSFTPAPHPMRRLRACSSCSAATAMRLRRAGSATPATPTWCSRCGQCARAHAHWKRQGRGVFAARRQCNPCYVDLVQQVRAVRTCTRSLEETRSRCVCGVQQAVQPPLRRPGAAGAGNLKEPSLVAVCMRRAGCVAPAMQIWCSRFPHEEGIGAVLRVQTPIRK